MDPNVPLLQAQLYRLSGSAGGSGLASVSTTTGFGRLYVTPGARFASDSEESGYLELLYGPFGSYDGRAYYDEYNYDYVPGEGYFYRGSTGYARHYETDFASIGADFRGLGINQEYVDEEGDPTSYVKHAWIQASDLPDDVDWYVTLLTTMSQQAPSFMVTLHDTIVLADDPVDEFGQLLWTANDIAISPLTGYLFKLPARFALRGLINSIGIGEDGSAISQDEFPLALTLQSQSIPSARASLLKAFYDKVAEYRENLRAGSTFSLPFSPLTQGVSSLYGTTPGGGAHPGFSSSNNDYSDIYLLGFTKGNFTEGTRSLDVSVAVSQTRVLCNSKLTCDGHGKCLSDGSCQCSSDYGGQFCTCKASRDCSGHGVCGLTTGCVCDEGYSGASCSKSDAPSVVVSVLMIVIVFAIGVAFA